MEHCVNHPEAPTERRCVLCEQPFCAACLEVVPGTGPVCADCELELADIPEAERAEKLEALRAEIRRTLPRPRPWWGWRLMFWVAVATPSILAGAHLYDLYRYHQFLSFVSREPTLPGVTMAALTDAGAAVERYYLARGFWPESLEEVVQDSRVADQQRDRQSGALASAITDPYSPSGSPLRYRHNRDGYRLCSIGPDRLDDGGIPLDRFTGRGDLCLGLPAPAP